MAIVFLDLKSFATNIWQDLLGVDVRRCEPITADADKNFLEVRLTLPFMYSAEYTRLLIDE